MSVRVTLNCQLKDQQFEALLPFLEANLPNVRGFKGCQRVSVLYNEDSNEMLLDEAWLSEEHHKNYIGFIASNGVLEELAAFLEEPPTIRYFSDIAV